MAKKVVNTSGKRKTAIARAAVKKGNGQVRINKKPIEIFQPEIARWKLLEPINIAKEHISKLDINVSVKGGGFMSQANAARTAIAKGILEYTGDPSLKIAFIDHDRSLLVSDSRRKDPKKPLGRGKKSKKQEQ